MKTPAYSIPRIFKLTDKLHNDHVLAGYVGTKPTGEDFDQYVGDVRSLLPKSVPYRALRQSLQHLAGVEITDQLAEQTYWRIAGNLHKLRNRKPVLPWDRQVGDEWVPAQIISSTPGTNRFGKTGAHIKLRALAGSPCTMVLATFWSRKFSSYLARKIFGFSKYDGPTPFRDQLEFTNLRCSVLVESELSLSTPRFRKVKATASALTWNKTLLAKRARLPSSKFVCPKGYKHFCHQCPIGYSQCPAGCHKLDYVPKYCSGCGKVSFFNMEGKCNLCVNCAT